MIISVIGGSRCTKDVADIALELGRELAKLGATVVCGGLSGVMEAVSKGAKSCGGLTIGILPGDDKRSANRYIDIAIPTGLGLARNTLVVRTGDVVIALPGEYGTLSEIAFALQFKKPVISLGSWDIRGVINVNSVDEAIEKVKKLLN